MNRTLYFILVLFSLISCPERAESQSFDYLENSVYVFNFIKYTSWPQKKSIIQIGIVGSTPLENELRNLCSRKVSNAINYVVKKISSAEASGMDVVIVAGSASGQLRSINEQTTSKPVLIISERENMGRSGACISFFIDEDNDYKTCYQLSLRNCKTRGLTVNEQIINNAVLIR